MGFLTRPFFMKVVSPVVKRSTMKLGIFDIWEKLYEHTFFLALDPFVDNADVFFDGLEVNLIRATRRYRK